VVKVPRASVVPPEKLIWNEGFIEAVTVTWSLVTVAVAKLLVSKSAVWVDSPAQLVVLALQVVIVPVLSFGAEDFVVRAAEFVQLKQ
jgi:hypothetical protein